MKYYSILRPIGPGTYPKPKGNFPANILNYADRTYIAEIGREAWGELEYIRPLSPQDVEDYELVPDPNETYNDTIFIPVSTEIKKKKENRDAK